MKTTAFRTRSLTVILVGFCLASPLAHNPALAGEEGPVAKVNFAFGGLFQKEKNTWRPLKLGDDIDAGALLVALPKAEITTKNGAIHLSMLADVGQRGPFPVLESAVVLNHAKDADLELTFERGLILLTNRKKEGAAKVRLKVRGESWILTLNTPGTVVGMEIFSRHAPGLPKAMDKLEDPITDLLMLVIKGRAFLDAGHEGLGLQAPPGLARVHWDSMAKNHTVQRLEKLPEELIRPFDDKEAKTFKEICLCMRKMGKDNTGDHVAELLKSDNKMDRLVGVTWAGAIDDLPHLFDALADPKHADSRDHAILVLRHWMGRQPGQVKTLFQALVNDRKIPPVQAKTFIQLLFGFDAEGRGHPETYQALIHLLSHSALPVRELARWHLVRLAPAGKDIAYNAAAPADQRRDAVARWQALIPEGKLPPEPKSLEKRGK